MAYEFKRLSDVNVIESMSDSTNVLIEENGEIVKMSGNKMIPTGVVKSVNGVTPDEAGNVVMSGLPEGATAYQQLVIHNEYEQPKQANMTYAEIVDALYAGKPLHGVIVDSDSSDSNAVTIYPITGISHRTSEIPYIEIKYFSAFDMQEGSIYMTEDNAFSGRKPGSGELS